MQNENYDLDPFKGFRLTPPNYKYCLTLLNTGFVLVKLSSDSDVVVIIWLPSLDVLSTYAVPGLFLPQVPSAVALGLDICHYYELSQHLSH